MKECLTIIQKALDEKKAERPLLYEFSACNPYLDYVVICSASNLRQVYAIAEHVAERVKEHASDVRAIEGDRNSRWVLVDLHTIVVHVFLDEEREHFQLEKLYADLPHSDFAL